MKTDISDSTLSEIVKKLCQNDSELEHVEFKESLSRPEAIAETICAIINALTRRQIARGYMIWGVRDADHAIVGSKFNPWKKKVGNEEFELWLTKYIEPAPDLEFRELNIDGYRLVVLIVFANPKEISKFRHIPFIRIGANTRKLSEFSAIEREMWERVLDNDYEMFPAKSNLSRTEVLSLLDYDTFYAMRRKGVPVEVDLVFEESVRCGIIIDNCDTTYDISNFGALLYAKDLDSFPTLSGKAVRIITYIGDSKISAKQEYRSRGGYIVDFNRMIAEILSNTISRETLNDDGIRRIEYQYPEVTLRELLANMLVHQDLYKKTMSPMVEIFTSRIEFTNLGKPLVPIKRIVDYPPQTRNENLAKEFYRTGICERRGSGWDKIADEANRYKFPAPTITTTNDTTNVTLSPHRVLADMTYAERMWSIYIYTCLLWSNKKYLTNALVRELFDIPESSKSMASLLINQAQKEKLITVFDENVGVRSRKYMPAYAKRESKNG